MTRTEAASKQVPAWFHNAVVDGLQRLHTLCLLNSPSAETIQLTANVWIDTLWEAGGWLDASDALRLARAFNALAAKADRWPAPRHVRDELPKRAERFALAPPTELAERRRANVDRLRELTVKLRADLVIKALAGPATPEAIVQRVQIEQRSANPDPNAQESLP